MNEGRKVVVAGGGAAGFFAAMACAESDPKTEVVIYEATAHPLAKVRVSGGGRCNVTCARFEPAELVAGYPRGARELLGPFHRFGPRETVAWFAGRGVELKTEADGRMFPVTDDSATIIDCLTRAAEEAGVRLVTRCGVASASREGGCIRVALTTGETVAADRFLIATGGTKGSAGPAIAQSFGHAVVPPVPSLFSFHSDDPRLRGLEGLSVARAAARVVGTKGSSEGPVLVTHSGLSGPAILKLSAWEARGLNASGYRFTLALNWAAPRTASQVQADLEAAKAANPRRQISTGNPLGLPARLWERLAAAAGLASDVRWANLSMEGLRALAAQVACGEFAVDGKSLNKEEFVTCGGVALKEVDFTSMESRICPGLHFAGEVLDIDGITGGYNFQSAWTTGWHAGRAMAGS